MILGIPKEVKEYEYRVSMTPIGVRDIVRAGHTVLVERRAGLGAGWGDGEYRDAGAKIVARDELFRTGEMIVKVKEPQASEFNLLREGQILFTYLHLAGYPSMIKVLLRRKIIGIGYETVQTEDGCLPLLAPMSEIAGKLASLVGANYLRKDFGGKGKLLSGVLGKDRGHVTVIGAGNVGTHAAVTAHGLGAHVTVFDLDKAKLEAVRQKFPDRLETVVSSLPAIMEVMPKTDLVIGAVLIAGRRAPRVVTKEMIQRMVEGSVIVDVAIDQGGCVEGIHVTTHDKPIYVRNGVIHNAVANMPSLVPRSASEALSRATFPYVKKLADLGFERATREDAALRKGVNLVRGEVVLPGLQ
ncbi:MAG: alanine dehydrogenase [Deltaproteobacteria bacterium]|nr:alanine dehydrogenase [Deltaproteobacteria bacterium]